MVEQPTELCLGRGNPLSLQKCLDNTAYVGAPALPKGLIYLLSPLTSPLLSSLYPSSLPYHRSALLVGKYLSVNVSGSFFVRCYRRSLLPQTSLHTSRRTFEASVGATSEGSCSTGDSACCQQQH